MSLKLLNEDEYQQMLGRIGALEILVTQTWTAVFKHIPDEHRDEIKDNALIEVEKRFDRLHPIAQRAAVETADGMLTVALDTARQVSK